MGSPFTSRFRDSGKGLQYPKDMLRLPFVCELCTVRAALGRELTGTGRDRELLALERMRMIDAANSWASATAIKTARGLKQVSQFCSLHDLPDPFPFSLEHPPTSPGLPILWAMEQYTLMDSLKPGSGAPSRISFNSARYLRSAASAFFAWDISLSHPSSAWRNRERQVLRGTGVSPTDDLLVSMTIDGMARRLGTESRPSMALNGRHIAWNIRHRTHLYSQPGLSLISKYNLAAANVAELFAWLGWLRSAEIFGVEWDDVEVIQPEDSVSRGLPLDTGAILLRLLDETKSNRYKVADVILAFTSASGLPLGYWLDELRLIRAALGWTSRRLFIQPNGRPWSSHFFRETHLYPLLELQRLEGDPILMALDGRPGNSIREKMFSLHSYRRGADGWVHKRREGCIRRATPLEIEEHGRWRLKNRGSESMPVHYRELSLEERLYITLLCM
jgi:hypothetical protein